MPRAIERRAHAGPIEIRTADDGTISISGFAAVFDSESYGEVVRRSAFDKTLAERDDVRFLVNHDGVPIARTKSGTLTLTIEPRGLKVQAEGLDPSNPTVQELVSAIGRGDIDQMSFAFADMQHTVNDDGLRELVQVRLYDVSVVTYPWYEETSVELNGRVLTEARSGRPDRAALGEIARLIPVLPREGRDLAGWTISDLRPLLCDAVEATLAEVDYWWLWVCDISDTWFVYILETRAESSLWQVDFTVTTEGAVTLGAAAEVVAKTTYLPVVNDEPTADGPAVDSPYVEMDSAPEEDTEARDAWLAELWRAETTRVS